MSSDTGGPGGGGTAVADPTPDPAPEHGFEQRHDTSVLARVQHVLHAQPTLGPLAVLVLAIIAFSILNERFLSAANLGLVLQQVTVIAVLALGQTLVILGVDTHAEAHVARAVRMQPHQLLTIVN